MITGEDMLVLAIKVAEQAHKEQTDKGGKPYIHHPMAVMQSVDTIKEKIVAVLHDVLEDTRVTIEDLILLGFSTEIVLAVNAISRKDNENYNDYLIRVMNNPLALKVKIADIKHNRDISRIPNPTDKDYKRIEKYIETLEKLEAYYEAVSSRNIPPTI